MLNPLRLLLKPDKDMQKRRQGCSQLTSVMGNVRVAHYLASFHKNVIFVKTRHCFICPPSLAALKFASTDGRGIKAHDVCTLTVYLAQLAYKLEFNSVQGRTLLNDWHRMENLKSAKWILSSPVSCTFGE